MGGGVPILSQFPAIFGFLKFLQVFDICHKKVVLLFEGFPKPIFGLRLLGKPSFKK